MTKRQTLPSEKLQLVIDRLTAVNRGFAIPESTRIELETCLERLPSLGHANRVVSAWIDDNKRLPTPSELMAIHREQVAAATPKSECPHCAGAGWRHVIKRGWSCAERCSCIREPKGTGSPACPRSPQPTQQPLETLAQEKAL